MAEHDVAPLGEIHIPYNWSYADSTARTAATGFIVADVGKIARQLSDNTLWMLTDESPITWVQVGGPPGAGLGDVVGPASATDNAITRYDTTTGKLIQNSAVLIDDNGGVTVPEIAAPATPASGKVAVYAKVDGKLYIKDDTGAETDLTAVSSGTIAGSTGSTDNAVLRADGTGGATAQASAVLFDDNGGMIVPEIVAPATPATGKVVIYAKSDGKLYIKDDTGTETDLTAAGSPSFPLLASDGTQGAPSYSFTNGADVGMYLTNGTPDHLGISVGNKNFFDMYQSAASQPIILMSLNQVTRLGFGNAGVLSAGFYSPRTGHVAVISSEASTPTSGTLYSPTADAGLVGGTEIFIDFDLGNVRQYVLPANRTVRAPSNLRNGDILTFIVIQDGTGGWAITSWNSVWKFVGGTAPTITTAANSVDIFQFWSNGTNLYEISRAQDVK